MSLFHKPRYQFVQVLAASIFVLLAVLGLYISSSEPLFWIIGGGAISASTMLAFLDPHTKTASSSNILISYFVALLVTLVIRFILDSYLPGFTINKLHNEFPVIIIIITIVMFIVYYLFSLLDISHPPACGLAFALIVHDTGYYKFIAIMIVGIILSLISKLSRRYMPHT